MNKITNATSVNNLAPIPIRSRAWMCARARAHKKMQDKNCLGSCYTWVSSSCSSTISKVSNCFPSVTLNKVASAIVVASYIGGAAYAVNNQTPWWKGTPPQYDIPGGAAIAIGASLLTCCLTAAIQQMRGNELDAFTWKCAAVASALSGLPFISQISQISTIKAESQKYHQRYDVDYPKWAGECQSTSLDLPSSRINSLECSLLEGAKSYIDQHTVESLMRSYAGASGVYFPPDISVVIKLDHSHENVLKIEDAKKICQENNYLYLTLPKASYYNGYSVHSLLPIPKFNKFIRSIELELYIENKQLFTDAIKEFTGFLCQARMSDLIGVERFFGQGYGWPRFDNAMVYLEKGAEGIEGKIALVDLDHFKLASNKDDLSYQVQDAVRFFPYHFEEIMKEAKKFYPNIEDQRSALEGVKSKAIKTYQTVYEKHTTYIKAKGITFLNPGEISPITEEAKKRVEESVAAELKNKINNYELTDDKYRYYFVYLKEHREESFNAIAKVLPEFIDQLVAFITEKLKEKVLLNPCLPAKKRNLLIFSKLRFF